VRRSTPAPAIHVADSPPSTVPRLQSPCSRLSTGEWRRSLSQDACRFMLTSTRTSQTCMHPSASRNTAGVRAKPMPASEATSPRPAATRTARVPKRSIERPDAALPTRRQPEPSASSSPRPATVIPRSSRISGRRGAYDAKIAPLTKNWTAMAAKARLSRAVKLAATQAVSNSGRTPVPKRSRLPIIVASSMPPRSNITR